MQRISRAPVLSATRSRDSCWITDGLLPWSSFSDLHDFCETPVLRLRERARLDDPDDVADLRLVLLVMRVELGRAAHDLQVLRVRLDRVDPDDDRLVHAARDDDASTLLTPPTRMLGLRHSRDRLALCSTFALRLRVTVALRARQALSFPPNLLRSFGGGLGLGLDFLSRLCLPGRCFFGYCLLGNGFGRRLLCHRLLCHRLLCRRFLSRRLLGLGGRGDRTLRGGHGLLGRLFDLLVLFLVVLFFVSHSSLDSRSLLVQSERSGCGRSRASRASAALCVPGRPLRSESAG